MRIVRALPLFGIVLIFYTLALSVSYYSNPNIDPMLTKLLTIKLPSQRLWNLYVGDLVVIGGLIILFIEILKSTNSNNATIVEHVLSTFVFIFSKSLISWSNISSCSVLSACSFLYFAAPTQPSNPNASRQKNR